MDEGVKSSVQEAIIRIIKDTASNKSIEKSMRVHEGKVHFIPTKYRILGGLLQSLNIKFGNFIEKLMAQVVEKDSNVQALPSSGKRINLALQDFPVELLHLVGRRCGFGAKPAIAVQVKGDALEEMPQIIDAEAAALEHLDLVVEPLDKGAALVMAEVVGDAIQPRVEQFQERVEAGQATRSHALAPGPYPADASRFRVRGIKDLAQFLAKVVRLFQAEAMGQEPI
jgi:hypothetical protein